MNSKSGNIPITSSPSLAISLPIAMNDKSGSFNLKIDYLKLTDAQQRDHNISNTYGHWIKVQLNSNNINQDTQKVVKWANADPIFPNNNQEQQQDSKAIQNTNSFESLLNEVTIEQHKVQTKVVGSLQKVMQLEESLLKKQQENSFIKTALNKIDRDTLHTKQSSQILKNQQDSDQQLKQKIENTPTILIQEAIAVTTQNKIEVTTHDESHTSLVKDNQNGENNNDESTKPFSDLLALTLKNQQEFLDKLRRENPDTDFKLVLAAHMEKVDNGEYNEITEEYVQVQDEQNEIQNDKNEIIVEEEVINEEVIQVTTQEKIEVPTQEEIEVTNQAEIKVTANEKIEVITQEDIEVTIQDKTITTVPEDNQESNTKDQGDTKPFSDMLASIKQSQNELIEKMKRKNPGTDFQLVLAAHIQKLADGEYSDITGENNDVPKDLKTNDKVQIHGIFSFDDQLDKIIESQEKSIKNSQTTSHENQ